VLEIMVTSADSVETCRITNFMQKWQKSFPEIHGVESGDITKWIPLNPLGRVLEKLAVAQLVEIFPTFY
jgi:hypothetical protein